MVQNPCDYLVASNVSLCAVVGAGAGPDQILQDLLTPITEDDNISFLGLSEGISHMGIWQCIFLRLHPVKMLLINLEWQSHMLIHQVVVCQLCDRIILHFEHLFLLL